jgi:hypothetical protein
MAQVTTGPTTKKSIHLARDLAIMVAVIITALSFFIGWYVGHPHQKTKKNSAASVQSGWKTYQNKQHGFQFDYPSAWTKPTFTENNAGSGKIYNVQFIKTDSNGKLSYYILLTMASDSTKTVSSSTIKQLMQASQGFVARDSSSFATVASDSQQKTSSISAYQIVDLPKLSVTAASLTYQISGGSSTCPKNQFAQNSGGSCIEKSDYNNASALLKSIKSI